MKVLVQPTGATKKEYGVDFVETVISKITLKEIESYLTDEEYSDLKEIYKDNIIPAWGIMPKSSNIRIWNSIEKGDYVLFSGYKQMQGSGIIKYKIQNENLAKYFWGSENNITWSCIYFITNHKLLCCDKSFFNELIGLSPYNRFQNTRFLNSESTKKFFDILKKGYLDLSEELLSDSYNNDSNYKEVLETIKKMDKRIKSKLNTDIKIIDEPLKLRKYKKIEDRIARNLEHPINYIANQIIKDKNGKINEQTIFNYEVNKMISVGEKELAKEMQEFFTNKKNNEPYDIISFQLSKEGKYEKIYIEVKSTKGNESTPIDITERELDFAVKNKENYYIYRIINSSSHDRYVKIIKGDPREKFRLEPTAYKIYAMDEA